MTATTNAEAGHRLAMFNLGVLFADKLDPPQLDEARTWLIRAAEAGNTDAMAGLGVLFADKLDPPQLDEARTWLIRAAEAGNTDAMAGLGVLFAEQLDPPPTRRGPHLVRARRRRGTPEPCAPLRVR